jgi:thymidylate synthase (FAD)
MIVKLISITPEAEKHVEYNARMCYESMDKMTADSHMQFLPNLLKNGHLSIFEHGSASFFIDEISRACSHQLVRQRLSSFTQKSQRYVREKDFTYTIPLEIQKNPEALKIYQSTINTIQNSYNQLTELGIRKEDARFLLPNAVHTTLTMTANFREWLHVIDLRVSLHAQWEIRELLTLIWKELYQKVPSIFDLTYFLHWSKDLEFKKEAFEKYIRNT